jgi:hypothetical protein
VISTLETMDDQTTAGTAWLTDRAVTSRNAGPLDDVAGWATAQSAGLAALAPQLPDAAGATVSHSLALLSEVSTRADGLRAALACPAGPSVGAEDAIGPAPVPCVPAAPAPPTNGPGPAVPGTGSTTQATPADPTTPSTGSAGTGGGSIGVPGGSIGVPVPSTPTIPGLSTPSVPGTPGIPGATSIPGLPLPSVTLPGTGSGPIVHAPSDDLPDICLPPLATIGDC